MSFVDNDPDFSTSNDGQLQPWAQTSKESKLELMILSEAGKPIYSFKKREDAVTLMPLCLALIDYARKTQKETLHSIRTSDNLVINFFNRHPIIIIVIYDAKSYVDAPVLVEQVEAQLISTLTAKTLKLVFEERPTYDLKRLLYGSEKLIDAIINISAFGINLGRPWLECCLAGASQVTVGMSHSGSNVTTSQRPHKILVPLAVMPPNTRESLHTIINNAVSLYSSNMVFSLLFRIGPDDDSEISNPNDEASIENTEETNDETKDGIDSDKSCYQIITICNHHDRHKLKIADVHLILALLYGSKVQLLSAECLWMPVCLPRFNQDAFLHSYISYINESKHCLVMMSIDRNDFANCQEARNLIEEKINSFLMDPTQRTKLHYRMSPLVHPNLLELQDKLMSDTLNKEESAEMQRKAQIYNSKVDLYHARQLCFLWYQTSTQVLWWQRSSRYRPNSIIHYMMNKMLQASLKHLWLKLSKSAYLGWHVPTFQLYAQFDGTITTNEAIEVIQRITSWIKKEEDNFSVKDYR